MYRASFILLSVVLLWTACNPSVTFQETLRIPDAEWERSEKAYFEFEIEDTLAFYDIYLTIRHGGDYPYQNLYLFTYFEGPEKMKARDTAQMVFADSRGRWLGKSIGDIYDYEFQFKEKVQFPKAGKYTLEVEQAMRDEVIPQVTDIGVKIEKQELPKNE